MGSANLHCRQQNENSGLHKALPHPRQQESISAMLEVDAAGGVRNKMG
jgi:hypothetical protein